MNFVAFTKNYNTFYFIPTISICYEYVDSKLEYMFLDISFLKWCITFTIKKMELKF